MFDPFRYDNFDLLDGSDFWDYLLARDPHLFAQARLTQPEHDPGPPDRVQVGPLLDDAPPRRWTEVGTTPLRPVRPVYGDQPYTPAEVRPGLGQAWPPNAPHPGGYDDGGIYPLPNEPRLGPARRIRIDMRPDASY